MHVPCYILLRRRIHVTLVEKREHYKCPFTLRLITAWLLKCLSNIMFKYVVFKLNMFNFLKQIYLSVFNKYVFVMLFSENVQPVNLETHIFIKPKKEVLSPEDISSKWEISEVYHVC